MTSGTLSHFGSLDELVQVVYQGFSRFVVLSKVDDNSWNVHLGLSGPGGRWWRGAWVEEDILKIVGSKSSTKLLEAFADRLAETFVQGELYVSDWSEEIDAAIKLTFGPSSKKPMHMPLVELTPTESAAHATAVFFDIALHAQSRECRLNPSPFASSTVSNPPRCADPGGKPLAPKLTMADVASSTRTTTSKADSKDDKIKALEAEVAELVRAESKSNLAAGELTSKPIKRPPKGASLANPNKKARKYQALEFASDEE